MCWKGEAGSGSAPCIVASVLKTTWAGSGPMMLPPTSLLGRLRVHGLIFVGRAGIKGRNYTQPADPMAGRG